MIHRIVIRRINGTGLPARPASAATPVGLRRVDRIRSASAGLLAAAVVALPAAVGLPGSAGAAQPSPSSRAVERELIFGSELMSDEELDRYRDEINRLDDDRARSQYRERHRQRLRERARNRGAELLEPAGILRRKDSQ